MAFEKEIKLAEGIVAEWKKEALNYVQLVDATKKGVLKGNKDLLEKIATEAAAPNPNVNLKDKYGKAIADTIRDLKELHANAEKNYNKFKSWSMAEPRSSMKAINKKLKLDKDAFAAVEVSTRKHLSEVSEVIQIGERAWQSDLKIAIENWITKAEALDKIINANANAALAIHAQFAENAKRFIGECERIIIEMKPERLPHDMEVFAQANKAPKLTDEIKLKLGPMVKVWQMRTVAIPKTIDLLEKNVMRVFKSAPPDSPGITHMRAAVNEKYESTRHELQQMNQVYTRFVNVGQQKGWI